MKRRIATARPRRTVTVAAALAIGVALQIQLPYAAAEPARAPGATETSRNAKFNKADLDAALWAKRFASPKREVFAKRDAIIAQMTLKAGDVIADVGAGTGIFVAPFAHLIGAKGHVFAIEVAKPFVTQLTTTFAGTPNVTVVAGKPHTTTLPTNSVDVAFVADTWHHFDDPGAMAADLARIVKPGGRLVVVELEKLEGLVSDWQFGHVHESRSEVIRQLQAVGFSKGRILGVAGMQHNWAVELLRDEK